MGPHCVDWRCVGLEPVKINKLHLIQAYLSSPVLGKMNRFQQTQSCKSRCELNLTFYGSRRWQDKMWKSRSWSKLSTKNSWEENVLVLAWLTFSRLHFSKMKKHEEKIFLNQVVCPNLIDFCVIKYYHTSYLWVTIYFLLMIMIMKKYCV